MKIYEIVDGEEELSIGCLLYFEKEKSYIIELRDYLDEWNAPLLLAGTVKKSKYTIGRELSKAWVCERVIPSGRQNIGSILANAKMSVYDEMALLDRTGGKCSQDNMYIKKLDSLPEYVKDRAGHNLTECVPCDDFSLLCFFADETIKKVSLKTIEDNYNIKKIISNETVFKSCHIAAGGYCVTFNDSIDIEAELLYGNGVVIPLSLSDFASYIDYNILDSTECCAILECSRQNLPNYLSKNTLVPVKKNVKGNLFTRGNIYRNEIIQLLNKQ